ncbi:MAG: NUDIX domain-containing protein [Rickettsiales bacterium]|jgi:8-oxo-dGTP pyrophosphatase MutT (NUDIX family)|nr:NUDIX domain-containing protein [Rickettsiales bacterium]
MEKLQLFDRNKNMLAGEFMLRGGERPDGKYYLVTMVFIEGGDGRFLIQKAAPIKDGKWATHGGHCAFGDDSAQCISKEISEELGLLVRPSQFQLRKSVFDDDNFIDLYYLNADVDACALTLQASEVAEVKWFSKDEIAAMIKSGEFRQSHASRWQMLFGDV